MIAERLTMSAVEDRIAALPRAARTDLSGAAVFGGDTLYGKAAAARKRAGLPRRIFFIYFPWDMEAKDLTLCAFDAEGRLTYDDVRALSDMRRAELDAAPKSDGRPI